MSQIAQILEFVDENDDRCDYRKGEKGERGYNIDRHMSASSTYYESFSSSPPSDGNRNCRKKVFNVSSLIWKKIFHAIDPMTNYGVTTVFFSIHYHLKSGWIRWNYYD